MGLLLSRTHLHGENNSLQSAFYNIYLNIFIIESLILYISRSALKEGSDFLTIEDLEAYGQNSRIAQLKTMDFLRWNESYFCPFERKLHLNILKRFLFF